VPVFVRQEAWSCPRSARLSRRGRPFFSPLPPPLSSFASSFGPWAGWLGCRHTKCCESLFPFFPSFFFFFFFFFEPPSAAEEFPDWKDILRGRRGGRSLFPLSFSSFLFFRKTFALCAFSKRRCARDRGGAQAAALLPSLPPLFGKIDSKNSARSSRTTFCFDRLRLLFFFSPLTLSPRRARV